MSTPNANLGISSSVVTYTPKAARVATAAVLPANTAAGAGVGATLTADAVGVLIVDGVSLVLNDRVFVQPGHANAADQAGIYKVTTAGTAGVAFILTRATDFDAAAAGEIELGAAVRPTEGTANIGKTYVLTTAVAITVDTTNLAFTEYASGAALDTRYSIAMSLWPGGTGVAAIAEFTSTTAMTGTLRMQVVNASLTEIARDAAGIITLPWQTLTGIDDLDGTITVAAGVITISGTMSFPIQLADIAFGWIRFKWTGTLGVGTWTLRVATKDAK